MKNLSLILTIILYMLIGMYAYVRIKGHRRDKAEIVNVERFKAQIDSLKTNNAALDIKYRNLRNKADSLQSTIDKTKQKLTQLKTTRHEKINAIDTLNTTELYRLFSEFATTGAAAKQ